jgi:predicted O-methyltransferase YrrM
MPGSLARIKRKASRIVKHNPARGAPTAKPEAPPEPDKLGLDLKIVPRTFQHLKYMSVDEAAFIRDLIMDHDLDNLLELGTYRGKGTAFMALIQEARGRGHVTTLDQHKILNFKPNVNEVLATFGVSHRATVKLTDRSFTHTMMQMLGAESRPVFDFAYIDGAHTWDGAGFSFFLVDKMLRPGGWIIFDDLDWTIQNASERRRKAKPNRQLDDFYSDYPEEERNIKLVRKVWELLVPEAGYVNIREWGKWGIAQKSAHVT